MISVQIEAEESLKSLRLCANRSDSSGMRLLESRAPEFQATSCDGPYSLYKTEAVFSSLQNNDFITCVLSHDELPEVDEVIGSVRSLLSAEERNPLLESIRKFWGVEEVYNRAVQPFLTKPGKVNIGPQDVFQKAITKLLCLVGFRAIDLERQDRIYHSETKIERATVDIVAYHSTEKILLLGSCTIGVPGTDDYEKLLHVREIFKASLPLGSPVYVAPVLFTMQENVSPFRTDMATLGLCILNTRDLAVLTKFIDQGQESKFVQFLTSQTSTALADF